MLRMLFRFTLMVLSILVVSVILVPTLILNSIRLAYREELKGYYKRVAIGYDIVGASLFYNTSKHTLSAITGYKQHRGNFYHNIQAVCIDFMLGKGHCYDIAIKEGLIHKIADDTKDV